MDTPIYLKNDLIYVPVYDHEGMICFNDTIESRKLVKAIANGAAYFIHGHIVVVNELCLAIPFVDFLQELNVTNLDSVGFFTGVRRHKS